jgi:hypothetical protein
MLKRSLCCASKFYYFPLQLLNAEPSYPVDFIDPNMSKSIFGDGSYSTRLIKDIDYIFFSISKNKQSLNLEVRFILYFTELNLMDWSSGFKLAYCQHANIIELIEPFRDAMVRMTNKYCSNATACRLEKP